MASPISHRPWLLTLCRRYWLLAPKVELSDCILLLVIELLKVTVSCGKSSGPCIPGRQQQSCPLGCPLFPPPGSYGSVTQSCPPVLERGLQEVADQGPQPGSVAED
ncbi:hypothetical protein PAMP_014137 [Pampus punctatissimus]